MDLNFTFQFQDWLFLPFFVISYLVYLLVKATRFRNSWIVIASYVFYGAMNPYYLILITYATIVDYLITWFMENSSQKRLWVTLSIINNVGLIAFFKYVKFITVNVNDLLKTMHLTYEIPLPRDSILSLMPVIGLSFYAFKSLGYVIDCYRGTIKRERNIMDYAAFVSFFPMLVAGPIERAGNLLAQLKKTPEITRTDIADGLSLFIVGLFKKLVLADGFAKLVDPIYKTPGDFSGTALLAATFIFAWQIYFDFSGYSDMARGVGRLFGFKIMLNFNNPYLATGLSDFWRRWHMSLSFWFRDYVYIPLGGNRKGSFRTYLNLFATMVISGMWHNPGWNFITWGAVHGLGSCATRAAERSEFYTNRIPKILKQAACFLVVCFAWIFFKAATWADACIVVKKIFVSGFSDPRCPLIMVGAILAVWAYQFIYESRFVKIVNWAPVRVALVVVLLMLTLILAGAGQPFAYAAF
ncbi:MAG: hypothetical protein C0404_11155 [Verrucomicrobia bacterium]|nr:hypothetical protein [Verrucomicrobiota bacterium]